MFSLVLGSIVGSVSLLRPSTLVAVTFKSSFDMAAVLGSVSNAGGGLNTPFDSCSPISAICGDEAPPPSWPGRCRAMSAAEESLTP